jgi:hypothetical protein
MKGKTGKPSAMRGGGLARKGVGMALKGGGMARKGTGSNATPGGKKLADGGMSAMKALPPRLGGSPNPPSDTPNQGPKRSLAVHAAQNYGGPRGTPGMVRPGFPSKPGMGNTPKTPGMVRPGFPSKPRPSLGSPLLPSGPGMNMPTGQQMSGAMNAIGQLPAGGVKTPGMATPMRDPATIKFADQQSYDQYMMDYNSRPMKSGGKVAKYAKGGAVKMTAGAGSGSGRLEKVAAHKAAKRVPATGLKNGGAAKKMKGGGLGKILTQLSPAAMLIKGEMPKMGLLGMGLDAIKGRKDQEGSSEGRSPDQVKKELGLKKGGKVKRK